MKTIKRAALLGIVLVLILSMCASAFAAYPSVSVKSHPKYSYRYTTRIDRLLLKSNSYPKSGGFRAKFDIGIYRISNGKLYASGSWGFSGKIDFKCKTKIYSWPTGSYKVKIWTYYRPYASSSWRNCKYTNYNFKVLY